MLPYVSCSLYILNTRFFSSIFALKLDFLEFDIMAVIWYKLSIYLDNMIILITIVNAYLPE